MHLKLILCYSHGAGIDVTNSVYVIGDERVMSVSGDEGQR